MTYLQSLDKALDIFIESKFCDSDFYFLKGSQNCMVATYNFSSVYIHTHSEVMHVKFYWGALGYSRVIAL